jgi:hypothetical protein
MSISMYSASVPVFVSILSNLSHCLDKAEAFVEQKKCDPLALTLFRLAPDMLPFTRQVQIACDTAKNGVARISGVEAPRFEDTETTFAELKARIQKTLDYLKSVSAAQIDGTETKEVSIPIGPGKFMTLTGLDALRQHALPNFFFHVTTAYAILRHNGVELGKRDYLMGAAAKA